MFRNSIRQKIVGIAAGLIILAVITSLLSMVMAGQVGHLLDELTNRYIPAYGHLARVNIRALERSLAMRRMMMAKMQAPGEDSGYESARKAFEEIEPLIKREADAARTLIDAIIADPSTPSDNAALGRLDDRIDNAVNDLLMRLNAENKTLLEQIDAKEFAAAKATTLRADALRDDFNTRIEAIRSDMLAQVASAAAKVMSAQQRAIIISGVVTAIAAILGFVFAMLVGSGITRPVMRLLESTREVEAGRLDGAITITTQDEIGQLSAAFNRMIETLRHNQRIRETFGRYINPRIAEGLLEQPAIAATEGQRRVMTVMFCDMKGFTSLSEGVTPSGLVKIMNLYLSTMSAPVHAHRGIIDKYIGDAIMAYWGAPFVEEAEQTHLAALAAIDMIG
ncbi:adenylate/guanylate cyclase domain-containing protein, partial [Bradyrhizobium sp. UFLA01-814]